MSRSERALFTARLVGELHDIVRQLEQAYPGRRFPLDGHLVGSLGEVTAEALFELALTPASTKGYDATDERRRRVEIKATYGNRSVSVRDTSRGVAQMLLVLCLSKASDAAHEVVFNGPISLALNIAGPLQSNGQRAISLSKLRQLNSQVKESERISQRADV